MPTDFESALKPLRTPHKVDHLILAPSYQRGAYDSHAIDAPFVFRHNNRFYMTHIGWDGLGYRTGLASSDDLLHWHKEAVILDRGPAGSSTEFNAALTWIVRDNDLWGSGHLRKVDGRYLGTYHAYPAAGYEAGPAAIGLCWSDDLYHWEVQPPFLHSADPDAAPWERGGLYKSCLVHYPAGHDRFYLFYNAKDSATWPWHEQTGLVTSPDLVHWTRHPANPVLPNGPYGAWDDVFASDPCVLRCGDVWAMFYYGLSSNGHARDGVAFSPDLLHWEKASEVLIDVGPAGSYDSLYAHKPGILSRHGSLYHYYCAVRRAPNPHLGEIEHNEIRGIGLATSGGL